MEAVKHESAADKKAAKAQDDALADYTAMIDAVVAGVKKLCDAGMGAPAAGALAASCYNECCGT